MKKVFSRIKKIETFLTVFFSFLQTDTSEQDRLQVFETILPIIDAMPLEEARKISLKTLLKNASIDKTYILNLFSICCSQLTNPNDFLNVCENSIINLASKSGKIEEISSVFNYDKQIPSEFIVNCLNETDYLSMYLMFFKMKAHQANHLLYNDIGNHFLQLKLDPNLEGKTFAIWFNLLVEIDELLNEENLQILPFTLKFIKVLNTLTEEVSSPKFLYFIKTTKKDVSFRYL